MKLYSLFLIPLSIILIGCGSVNKSIDVESISWEEVQSIPASFGDISEGVSAAFVGLLDDNLIVAGGCNFPETPAAEGGKKVFYKDILMFEDAEWTKVGELPEPIAYGVSVSYKDKLIFVGGQNEKSLRTVYELKWEDDLLQLDTLPSLPVTIDNMAGTLLNSEIFVLGGNQNGKASSAVWRLDLNNPTTGWQSVNSIPVEGGLVQLIAVSQYKKISQKHEETAHTEFNASAAKIELVVYGGFSPATNNQSAKVNQDVWNYDFLTQEWKKANTAFPSEKSKNSLSGGVGAAVQDSLILLMGGVNQQIFEDAINRNLYLSKTDKNATDTLTQRLRAEAAEYMHHPAEWYRFNDEVWLYNLNSETWKSLGKFPQAALAGASIVANEDEIYIVNGETKPGIRTPKIWKLEIRN